MKIDEIVGIVVVSPALRAIINDQVEAGISAIASTLPRNHEVMRTFCFLKTESYHRRSRCLESWL